MADKQVGALRVELSARIEAFVAKMAQAVKVCETSFKRMVSAGKSISSLGSTLTTRLTLPVLAAVGLITKTTGDFQTAMKKAASEAGATGTEVDELRNAALRLGPAFGQGPTAAAGALEALAGEGMTARQSLATLHPVLALAKADSLELGDSVKLVAGNLRAYRIKIKDAAKVTDLLKVGASAAGTSSMEFGTELAKLGPRAMQAGSPIERTAAMLAKLEQGGLRGKKATAGVEAAFEKIITLGGPATKALSAAGASIRDQAGNLLPMEQILQRLQPLAGNTKLMFEIFGESAGTALGMLARDGGAGLKSLEEQLKGVGGETMKAAQENMSGFAGATARFWPSLERMQIAIGESGLLDSVTWLVDRLAGLANRLGEVNPKVLRLGVLGILVAAAMGPVLVVVGSVIQAIGTLGLGVIGLGRCVIFLLGPVASLGMLLGGLAWRFAAFGLAVLTATVPIWAVPAALAAVGYSLYFLWDDIVGFVEDPGNMLNRWFTETFPNATKVLGDFVTEGLVFWDQWKTDASAAIDGIGPALTRSLEKVRSWGADVVASVGQTIRDVGDWFGKKFDEYVTGPAWAAMEKIKAPFVWLDNILVRHSIFPDMIKLLGAWADKLKDYIAPGAEAAAKEVTAILDGMLKKFEEATPTVRIPKPVIDGPTGETTIGGSDGGKPGKDFEDLGKAGESASKKVASAWQSANDSVAKGIGDMVSKGALSFSGLRQSLSDALANMSSKLFEVGLGSFGGKGKSSGLFGGLQSLLGFKNGGSFTVGGSGPADSQLVQFWASPRERVSVSRPGEDGGPGGGFIQQNTFHMGAGSAREARRAVQEMLPQLARAGTMSAVDANLRGGRVSAGLRR